MKMTIEEIKRYLEVSIETLDERGSKMPLLSIDVGMREGYRFILELIEGRKIATEIAMETIKGE